MAAALMEVSEGRIPGDRIALRELCKEMKQWPALDEMSERRGRCRRRLQCGMLGRGAAGAAAGRAGQGSPGPAPPTARPAAPLCPLGEGG